MTSLKVQISLCAQNICRQCGVCQHQQLLCNGDALCLLWGRNCCLHTRCTNCGLHSFKHGFAARNYSYEFNDDRRRCLSCVDRLSADCRRWLGSECPAISALNSTTARVCNADSVFSVNSDLNSWRLYEAKNNFLFNFSIPKCYNIQINTVRQSVTQHLFYIQRYICQGDMFRPSRSSWGPPRKHIQELFSFSALWVHKHVALTYITLYIKKMLCYKVTYIFFCKMYFFWRILHVRPSVRLVQD
jgi:hypothetical protein